MNIAVLIRRQNKELLPGDSVAQAFGQVDVNASCGGINPRADIFGQRDQQLSLR